MHEKIMTSLRARTRGAAGGAGSERDATSSCWTSPTAESSAAWYAPSEESSDGRRHSRCSSPEDLLLSLLSSACSPWRWLATRHWQGGTA